MATKKQPPEFMFDAATLRAIPTLWLNDGTLDPDAYPDVIPLSPVEVSTFVRGNPPAGKALGVNAKGRPAWVPAAVIPRTVEDARTAVQEVVDSRAQSLGFGSAAELLALADEPGIAEIAAPFRSWLAAVRVATGPIIAAAGDAVAAMPEYPQ